MTETRIETAQRFGRERARRLAMGADNPGLVKLICSARVGERGRRILGAQSTDWVEARALRDELERIAFVRTALAATKAATE